MKVTTTAKRIVGNILVYVSILLVSGCQSPGYDQAVTSQGIHLTEENEVPSFLNQYNESVKELYVAVRSYQELLKKVPCYCGCIDEELKSHESHQSHESLYHCFNQKQESDKIYWTDHGANCGISLQELEDVTKKRLLLMNHTNFEYRIR
jgi:hypothetical protein